MFRIDDHRLVNLDQVQVIEYREPLGPGPGSPRLYFYFVGVSSTDGGIVRENYVFISGLEADRAWRRLAGSPELASAAIAEATGQKGA
jgi:hypothetical protein